MSHDDAGCGGPSYHLPINRDVIERIVDARHGRAGVQARFKRCGSDLGHVFDDRPAPGGERFCTNSAALDFAAPI